MMNTKFQQSIVALLASDITKERTIRKISQELGKNYRNTYDSLQDLIKQKVVKKKRIGRSDVCSLDLKQKDTVNAIVSAEELRKVEIEIKYPVIKRLIAELVEKFKKYTAFFCLVVFGSYASGTARTNSDLDILIILPNLNQKNNLIKEINALQITTTKKISSIIIEEKEFEEMLRSKEELNVGKETLRKHIIFYNPQIFWEMVKYES